MVNDLEDYLMELYPDAKCELNYNKDYELLIAVCLSAQTTDKRVNMVTDILFNKYRTLEELSEVSLRDIENIIKPIGTYTRKAVYVKEIANILVREHNGIVPNNRKVLESMPGVGHKTCNVVLSNLFDVPCIAVDTHVSRVSKRLGLCKDSDDVEDIERKLKKKFKRENWSLRHHQLVLFGRYHCMAKSPKCGECKLKDRCRFYKK